MSLLGVLIFVYYTLWVIFLVSWLTFRFLLMDVSLKAVVVMDFVLVKFRYIGRGRNWGEDGGGGGLQRGGEEGPATNPQVFLKILIYKQKIPIG